MGAGSADFGVRGPNPEAERRSRRLHDAIQHSGKGRRQVAKEAGIHFKTLENYLSGTDIQTETVAALAAATGVDTAWLAFGFGLMIPGQKKSIQTGGGLAAYGETDLVRLPLFEAKAAAGDGVETFSERAAGHLAFSRGWLERWIGRREENLALMEAVGESMSPTINDGDTMMIDLSIKEARSDSIYIIATLSGLIVKRIQIGHTGGYHIISDNPQFKTETIKASDRHEMRVVAEVVWHGGFGR